MTAEWSRFFVESLSFCAFKRSSAVWSVHPREREHGQRRGGDGRIEQSYGRSPVQEGWSWALGLRVTRLTWASCPWHQLPCLPCLAWAVAMCLVQQRWSWSDRNRP